MAVLNQKRKDLAELEEAHDTRILILADSETAYGEMAAEIERRDEETEEKPQPVRQERLRESEDETVVLGGDAPISFEKALGQEPKRIQPPADAEIKYDRRDAQRAALDERERLRALFESAKPQGEDAEVVEEQADEVVAPKPSRGHRRGKGSTKPEASPVIADAAITSEIQVPRIFPLPTAKPFEPEPEPVKPVFDPSLVADLTKPTVRPKLLAAASPASEPKLESAPKPTRGRPKAASKISVIGPIADAAPARKVTKPAAKAKLAPVEPAPKPKATPKAVKPKSKA